MVIRHPIVDALMMIGTEETLPALAAALKSADPYLALKILDYFNRKANSSHLEYVEPFLTDSLPPLQIRAAATVLAISQRQVDL